MSPKSRTPAAIAIAVAAVGILLSGCSASSVINTGGDTQCKDFTTQDQKKQNDEISKMLKDKSGTDPTNLQIDATRLSAQTWCQTLGKPDSKISEAPHG
jgi:acid stress chaperone HdeA